MIIIILKNGERVITKTIEHNMRGVLTDKGLFISHPMIDKIMDTNTNISRPWSMPS